MLAPALDGADGSKEEDATEGIIVEEFKQTGDYIIKHAGGNKVTLQISRHHITATNRFLTAIIRDLRENRHMLTGMRLTVAPHPGKKLVQERILVRFKDPVHIPYTTLRLFCWYQQDRPGSIDALTLNCTDIYGIDFDVYHSQSLGTLEHFTRLSFRVHPWIAHEDPLAHVSRRLGIWVTGFEIEPLPGGSRPVSIDIRYLCAEIDRHNAEIDRDHIIREW